MGNNWVSYFLEQYSNGLKKNIFHLIGAERYAPHEQTIQNLAAVIKNDQDYKKVGEFFAEIYEAGFMKAVEEHRKLLEKHGLRVTMQLINQKNQLDSQ